MRAVVQRVTRAKVTVDSEITGEIKQGLVVLLGVARDDAANDVDYLAAKIVALRIFDDDDGKMNRSVKDVDGGVLVISQFTLYGDVRRGLRPSWIEAAAPEVAKPLYDLFVVKVRELLTNVATGSFRSLMQVEFVNDGPGDDHARQPERILMDRVPGETDGSPMRVQKVPTNSCPASPPDVWKAHGFPVLTVFCSRPGL